MESLLTQPLASSGDDALLEPSPASSSSSRTQHKVAIVGCGVAGIVAARVLKQQGFGKHLAVYEATDSPSGVWSSGYTGYGIQTPGNLYEFPDKELPTPKDYLDGPSVKKYCQEYITEHQLEAYIHYKSKVTAIRKVEGDDKWELTIESNTNTDSSSSSPSVSTAIFDFVLLATGIYGPQLKYIPKVKGIEYSKGELKHSEDLVVSKAGDRKGKRVLVVGFGSSSLDCAMTAYQETGMPPILLFRQAHWCVPRKVLGLIPMEWLIYSRFGQGTLPKWQDETCGPVEWFIQTFLYVLIWAYWRIVEILFSAQLGLYGSSRHLRPTLAIEKDMYSGQGVICHPDVFPMMHRGQINAIKGSIKQILPSGDIELQNGSVVQVDVIVFATGFRRVFDFFPEELMNKKEEDGFYAYRNMIVPGVPNIAFLNSNVTTFSNITTPGLQAAWIAHLIKGRIQLPKDMEAKVETERMWRRKHLKVAGGDTRAFLIQLHQIRYWDSLLRDMGINVKRKHSKWGGPVMTALMNFFCPINSSDYKTVITGGWANNKGEVRPIGYKPSFVFEWGILGLVGAALYVLSGKM